MRVAVYFDGEHPESGGEDSVVAYRLGRIEDGVHNTPIGHEPVELEEFVQRIVAQAQADYPDHRVTQDERVKNRICVERLIDNGDDSGSWIPANKFDPDVHTPVGAGRQIAREITAELSSQAGDS